MLCLCSSCGLAEELEQESTGKQKTNLPKSACGSVSILLFIYISRASLLWPNNNFHLFVAVLPWRRFPMCQLSVRGDASVQTRREDRAGQEDADGRLKQTSLLMIHDVYIPWFCPSTETRFSSPWWRFLLACPPTITWHIFNLRVCQCSFDNEREWDWNEDLKSKVHCRCSFAPAVVKYANYGVTVWKHLNALLF